VLVPGLAKRLTENPGLQLSGFFLLRLTSRVTFTAIHPESACAGLFRLTVPSRQVDRRAALRLPAPSHDSLLLLITIVNSRQL
jgi:hypothetical protein